MRPSFPTAGKAFGLGTPRGARVKGVPGERRLRRGGGRSAILFDGGHVLCNSGRNSAAPSDPCPIVNRAQVNPKGKETKKPLSRGESE
eukprot:2586237-Pyramimonas_sp.AAC.1